MHSAKIIRALAYVHETHKPRIVKFGRRWMVLGAHDMLAHRLAVIFVREVLQDAI